MTEKIRGLRHSVVAVSMIVVLILVILLLWFGRRMSEAILPGMNSARTTSMEPVALILRDSEDNQELRLRVPKAYLTKAQNWRGGSQRFIWIETALPALNPTPAVSTPPRPDSPEYSRWLADSDGGIYIVIENAYSRLPASVVRERWLKNYAVDRNSRANVAYELISDHEFGLAGYRSLACHPRAPSTDQPVGEQEWQCQKGDSEYYVSNEGDPPVHIVCHLDGATGIWQARRGCQVYTSFGGFTLRYIFRRTQLSRWQEFDSGVRKLLESFLVSEAQ